MSNFVARSTTTRSLRRWRSWCSACWRRVKRRKLRSWSICLHPSSRSGRSNPPLDTPRPVPSAQWPHSFCTFPHATPPFLLIDFAHACFKCDLIDVRTYSNFEIAHSASLVCLLLDWKIELKNQKPSTCITAWCSRREVAGPVPTGHGGNSSRRANNRKRCEHRMLPRSAWLLLQHAHTHAPCKMDSKIR